jgi:hypothetical protein
MKRLYRAPALVLLLGLTLLLAGCESVKIGSLLQDPSRYANKKVHVRGTVVNSMGLMGRGAYAVSDDTGTIWVISKTGVPAKGARVDVEGEVFQGAQFAGQSLGVALREKRHRTF